MRLDEDERIALLDEGARMMGRAQGDGKKGKVQAKPPTERELHRQKFDTVLKRLAEKTTSTVEYAANEYLTSDKMKCRITSSYGTLNVAGMEMVVDGKPTLATMKVSFIKMSMCKERPLGFAYPGIRGAGNSTHLKRWTRKAMRALCADHNVRPDPIAAAAVPRRVVPGGSATTSHPSCCVVRKIIVACSVAYVKTSIGGLQTPVLLPCHQSPAANSWSAQVA